MVGPSQSHPGHYPTRAQRAQLVGGEIMTDRQVNLTYFSPKVEKRTSPIEGRGLFSKANIKKGEVVVVKGGYILTKNQRDEIGIELGPSEIQIPPLHPRVRLPDPPRGPPGAPLPPAHRPDPERWRPSQAFPQ